MQIGDILYSNYTGKLSQIKLICGKYIIISGPCDFYSDSQTNISRWLLNKNQILLETDIYKLCYYIQY